MIYTTLWLYGLGVILMAMFINEAGPDMQKAKNRCFILAMIWPFIVTFGIFMSFLPKEKTNA